MRGFTRSSGISLCLFSSDSYCKKDIPEDIWHVVNKICLYLNKENVCLFSVLFCFEPIFPLSSGIKDCLCTEKPPKLDDLFLFTQWKQKCFKL